MTGGQLIRTARRHAGLSQAALGERLSISQPAIARLEAAGDAITVAALRRTLAALDLSLELSSAPRPSSIDETLIREQLRLTPAERLERYEDAYSGVRELALAAARARELA